MIAVFPHPSTPPQLTPAFRDLVITIRNQTRPAGRSPRPDTLTHNDHALLPGIGATAPRRVRRAYRVVRRGRRVPAAPSWWQGTSMAKAYTDGSIARDRQPAARIALQAACRHRKYMDIAVGRSGLSRRSRRPGSRTPWWNSV